MLKKPASGVLAGHRRLTNSAAFTNVPRLIRRGVNLRGSTYGPGKSCSGSSGRAGENVYDSPPRHWALTGHGPLTISRAFTNLTRLIRRIVNLAAVRKRIRFGHCQLTDSLARTDVVLFIHRTVRLIILRVADLVAALLDGLFELPANDP